MASPEFPVPVRRAFADASSIYQAGPSMWTSQMFPVLEPYTERHRSYFQKLVSDVKSDVVVPFEAARTIPPVRDGLMILIRDFEIVWQLDDAEDSDNGWYCLVVPAGFVTDIASIPLIVQLIFHMHSDGSVRAAALPHDLLYQLKKLMRRVAALWRFVPGDVGTVGWVHDDRPWTKAMDDKFFAKIMKAYGTPLSGLIYAGVRFGGGLAYLRNDASRFYTAALYDVPINRRNAWQP